MVSGKPLPEDVPQPLQESLPFASPIVFRVGDIVVHRCEDQVLNVSRQVSTAQRHAFTVRHPSSISAGKLPRTEALVELRQ